MQLTYLGIGHVKRHSSLPPRATVLHRAMTLPLYRTSNDLVSVPPSVSLRQKNRNWLLSCSLLDVPLPHSGGALV